MGVKLHTHHGNSRMWCWDVASALCLPTCVPSTHTTTLLPLFLLTCFICTVVRARQGPHGTSEVLQCPSHYSATLDSSRKEGKGKYNGWNGSGMEADPVSFWSWSLAPCQNHPVPGMVTRNLPDWSHCTVSPLYWIQWAVFLKSDLEGK